MSGTTGTVDATGIHVPEFPALLSSLETRMREIFGQEAFTPFRGKEISPGAQVQSDDELDALGFQPVLGS